MDIIGDKILDTVLNVIVPLSNGSSAPSGNAINKHGVNDASSLVVRKVSGVSNFYGVGITYDGTTKVGHEIKMMYNSCYIEVLLQIFAALYLGKENCIEDDNLKDIIKKINEPKANLLVAYKGKRVVSVTKFEIACVWPGMVTNNDSEYTQINVIEALIGFKSEHNSFLSL